MTRLQPSFVSMTLTPFLAVEVPAQGAQIIAAVRANFD
jgi:hypothetical protein